MKDISCNTYYLRLKILRTNLLKQSEQSKVMKNVYRFFKALDSHKKIGSLTTDMICDLIDRIEIHEGQKITGLSLKYNKVDIY